MTRGNDDFSKWLRDRPFQDNRSSGEPSVTDASAIWDEWVTAGREIPDSEERLIRILEDEVDPVIRSSAAMALGFIGGDDSFEPLVRALQNDIPIVAMEAAASLGRLRNPEAIESLGDALKNPDSNVRANACIALGSLGGEKARTHLKSAQQDEDPFVRSAADQALSTIK